MAEDFGVEDRGHFYDPVGALRDVVVNHLMQVVAAAAMEPPAGARRRDAQGRDVRASSARCRDADPTHYVRGQYDGYREIDGVAAGLDDRDLRGAAARDRQLALVGRAVLHPHGQAAAGRPRPSCGSCSSRPPRLGFVTRRPPPRARPARRQARPRHGHPAAARRPARRRDRAPSRSRSTWSSPRRAARAPTPYEVLLHAAMNGRQRALHARRTASRRPGGSCSRCSTRPPPVHPYAPGSWGPRRPTRLVAGLRPLARAVGGVMTHEGKSEGEPAAADASRRAPRRRRRSRRSPTTRSCRTATPARSSRPTARSTGCACPSFDSPSVFGTLLDRQAGSFRLGPFGINVPTAARLRAGHEHAGHDLERRRRGWVLVRDALTMGPRRGEDTVTPHTRPPADDDADHLLVRTVDLPRGQRRGRAVCEPVFDYGRDAGRVDAGRRRPPHRRRDRRRT